MRVGEFHRPHFLQSQSWALFPLSLCLPCLNPPVCWQTSTYPPWTLILSGGDGDSHCYSGGALNARCVYDHGVEILLGGSDVLNDDVLPHGSNLYGASPGSVDSPAHLPWKLRLLPLLVWQTWLAVRGSWTVSMGWEVLVEINCGPGILIRV